MTSTTTTTSGARGVLAPAVAALLALDALVDLSILPAVAHARLGLPQHGSDVDARVQLQLPQRADAAATASDLAAWAAALDAAGVEGVRVRVRALAGCPQPLVCVLWTLDGVSLEAWSLFPPGFPVEHGDTTVGALLAIAGVEL